MKGDMIILAEAVIKAAIVFDMDDYNRHYYKCIYCYGYSAGMNGVVHKSNCPVTIAKSHMEEKI